MLQSAQNLVKFVKSVKPNEDATISLSVRIDCVEAFFYLHEGNGREVFNRLIILPSLDLSINGDNSDYIILEGIFDDYKVRVTFLNKR
jgi:hypothetical protein